MTWQQLSRFGDNVSLHWLLQARLKRVSHRCLALDYELVAPAAEVMWPTASISPQRRDELWLSTCLELFIANSAGQPYWEINLSPTGDWNVYQLDDYRQGLKPEPGIEPINMRSNSAADRHQLHAMLQVPPALLEAPKLQANLCAVLQHVNKTNSYWAVCHPGHEADFHARAGFVLEV